jgi:hypothetical protein
MNNRVFRRVPRATESTYENILGRILESMLDFQ